MIVAAIAGVATILVILGIVIGRVIEARQNVDVYLHGPGVVDLPEGALVATGVQPVGEVRSKEDRDGKLTAHLVINREYARQIPQGSSFRVESLNKWMPGRLGVRVYAETSPPGAEPIADGAVVQASSHFLPPQIPPRFYLLILGAMLLIAFTIAVAAALYKMFNRVSMFVALAIGMLVLIAAYLYFGGQIAAPDPPEVWQQIEATF